MTNICIEHTDLNSSLTGRCESEDDIWIYDALYFFVVVVIIVIIVIIEIIVIIMETRIFTSGIRKNTVYTYIMIINGFNYIRMFSNYIFFVYLIFQSNF